MDVRGEIAIAKIEPGFAAIDAESFQEMKRFAAHAPAFGGIDDAGQRVRDDVQVGRNFQAVQDDVIAGIDDDGEVVRIHGAIKTEKQFRCADTAGKSCDREFF